MEAMDASHQPNTTTTAVFAAPLPVQQPTPRRTGRPTTASTLAAAASSSASAPASPASSGAPAGNLAGIVTSLVTAPRPPRAVRSRVGTSYGHAPAIPPPNCTYGATTASAGASTSSSSMLGGVLGSGAIGSTSSGGAGSSSNPTPHISVRTFLNSYSALIGGAVESRVTLKSQVSAERLAEIASACSMSLLKNPELPAVRDMFDATEIPSDMQCTTLRESLAVPRLSKENNYYMPPKREETDTQPELITRPEAVLSISMYHGGRAARMSEFVVLGSQRLTALRDKLYCPSDVVGGGQTRPSSYFFIEGVFFNDMRDPAAVDYSRSVLDWINEPGKMRATHTGLGNFAAASMHDVRFEDLTIRLGQPYLYCHQGDCEHVITVRDMRIIHLPTDGSDARLFPKQTFQSRVKTRKCLVCDILPAKLATYNDRLALETPCYFCDVCYDLLHKDESGRVMYEHTVSEYFHELA
ncbi:hypothetical protein CAOG_04708 [Capsaspora owczarzaki ATCC 30864]|nr:hypothetical protein CAOG_04708 [Capsaspora owczarzaki ATCC 30864]|eukprot:XP_004347455.1 hypothetical protein CAOG_04708 [Capsaspora owczarzaki ATCC 30864]